MTSTDAEKLEEVCNDRSKYLEIAKSIYPFCITVNVLFRKKEIFGESSNKIDYTAKNVSELEDIIKMI